MFQRMWHIDIPTILPIIVILPILRSGSMLQVGFEKILLMQNSLNINASEVISTWGYKIGIVAAHWALNGTFGVRSPQGPSLNLFSVCRPPWRTPSKATPLRGATRPLQRRGRGFSTILRNWSHESSAWRAGVGSASWNRSWTRSGGRIWYDAACRFE